MKKNNKTKEAFEKHWVESELKEISKSKIRGAERFLGPVIKLNKRNLKILDVGCGEGTHLKVINELDGGYKITGLDFSKKSINICEKRFRGRKDIQLIEGSALNLPFGDKEFDIVFSFGTIGYVDNPRRAFEEKVRVLKDKGLLGIWVYPKKRGILAIGFNFARKICSKNLGPTSNLIANFTVPLLQFLPTRSKINLFNSSWEQCLEVVKVNLFPPKLYFFREEEIKKLFSDNNIRIIYEDKKEPITIWGAKIVEQLSNNI